MIARVGIKTVPRNVVLSNYGSFFQHYALRKVLRQLGFRPYRVERSSWRDEFLMWMLPIRILRVWVLSWFGRKDFRGWNGVSRLAMRMKFILDYWRMIGALFEDQGGAFAYVAGGDSVWYGCDRDAFLMDVEGKKIAYAASAAWDWGADKTEWRSLAREALAGYSAVGVRETAGMMALKLIDAEIAPHVVVDPVMLLTVEEWRQLVGHRCIFSRPTILYYVVNAHTCHEINIDAVKECAVRLNCDLACVGVQGAEAVLPRGVRRSPSPSSFLSMMSAAKYVVTNSFHGIVFSLMFNKPFAFLRQGAVTRGDANLRQKELLGRFDLCDRDLGTRPTAEKLVSALSYPMDMASLNEKLTSERSRCLEWLGASLK